MSNIYTKKDFNRDDNMKLSEDDLLNMPPELLLELQKYLLERRRSNPPPPEEKYEVSAQEEEVPTHSVLKAWNFKEMGVLFEEVENNKHEYVGVRITQDGRTYIQKKQRISERFKTVVEAAHSAGLSKVWRYNHPQDGYMNIHHIGEKYNSGIHHIGFSATHDERWIFVLGGESNPPKINIVTFNKHSEDIVVKALGYENKVDSGNPVASGHWSFMPRGGRDIKTHPADLEKILEYYSK